MTTRDYLTPREEEKLRKKYKYLVSHLTREDAQEALADGTNDLARDIGRSPLADLPGKWTGWKSDESIRTEKVSYEHPYSMNILGRYILAHIKRYGGISFTKYREFVEVCRQVHHMTSTENRLMAKYQKMNTFSGPLQIYRSAYYNGEISKLCRVENRGAIRYLS